MQKRPVIITDLHDVLGSLVRPWIEFYQSDSDHYELKYEHITDWNISQFVKPQYEKRIYEYLTDKQIARTIFHSMKPNSHAVEVTKWLQQYADLWVVTDSHYGTLAPNGEWIERYFPHIPIKQFSMLSNKNLFKGDYIIDDKPKTIQEFDGTAIMFNCPWNQSTEWNLRVNNWLEIKSYFQKIFEKGINDGEMLTAV